MAIQLLSARIQCGTEDHGKSVGVFAHLEPALCGGHARGVLERPLNSPTLIASRYPETSHCVCPVVLDQCLSNQNREFGNGSI